MKRLKNFLSRKQPKEVKSFDGVERKLSKVVSEAQKSLMNGIDKKGKDIEKSLKSEGFEVSYVKSELYFSGTDERMVVEMVFNIQKLSKNDVKAMRNAFDGEVEVNGNEFEVYVPVDGMRIKSY